MGAPWSLLVLVACDPSPSDPSPSAVPEYTSLELGDPQRVDGLASLEPGGEPILVVATSNPTSLRWFASTPGLDTQPDGEIPLSASGPLLSPGDLDQDGYPDLVVAVEEAWVTLTVFAGAPGGLASEPLVSIPTARDVDAERLPRTAHGLGAGDFDGDGVPDIAVGSYAGVSLYSGVDPARVGYVRDECNGFGEAVAVPGDVDGDGYDDAVASGFCGVMLLPGGPDSLGTAVDPGGRSTQDVLCYGPGDLDDDGFADVLCAWGYVPLLAVYRGSPAGLLDPAHWSTWVSWVEPPDVVRRDVDHDGDGADDLVIGWSDADMAQGGVLVYAGGTSEVQLAVPGQRADRRLGDEVVADLDLDLDGRPDLVTTAADDGMEEVRVYRATDLWAE